MFNFKVGHMNVRSLMGGFDSLKNYICSEDFSIFAVSETWLNENIDTNIFLIPNYRFIRMDREGRGGGIGLFIKNSMNYNVIDLPNNTFLEQLWVSINLSGKSYLFGVLYRPPKSNINSALEALDNTLSQIMPTSDALIMVGDLNIDLLYIDNVNSLRLNNIFDVYDLSQIISEPTRVTDHSNTLLDIIVVSNSETIKASKVVDIPGVSDHYLTYCELSNIKVKNNIKFVQYRDFKYFNEQSFVQDLNMVDWDYIYSLSDVDDMLNFFNENVMQLFDNHAPLRKVRVSKPPAPWMTSTIKDMIKLRDNAFNKYKKTKLPADFNSYKDLRNYTTGAIRREKRAYLDFVLINKDSKRTWQTLRSMEIINNKNSRNDIPDDLCDVNVINSYFNVSADINSTEDVTLLNKYDNISNSVHSFRFITTDYINIQRCINKIKTNSTGLDGISVKMLLIISTYLINHITFIINSSITSSTFPSSWKHSTILPLAKIANPTEISQLRPISILPTMSKILEMIMHQQISEYVLAHKIIPPIQSGFRPNHSTATALTHITDDIIHNTDESKLTCLILLDFSKAFDTLDHSILCNKLIFFGFDVQSVTFIRSYLSDRTQRVCLRSNVSDPLSVKFGVPQGSILGPLLFSIYISDFHTVVTACDVHHYADDTQLYYNFSVNDLFTANRKINEDLNSLLKISLVHKLKLNSNKSQVILFGPKKKRLIANDLLTISLGDTELKIVNECKNLGVWFDSDLRFTKHINQLLKTSYSTLKQLYPQRNIMNQNLKLKLCESLIFSRLSYCDVLVGSNLLKVDINRLQMIQNSCIRFSYGIRKFDHISHKFEDAGWMKIDDMYRYHFLCFTHKILISNRPSYLYNKIVKLSDFNVDRSSRNKNILLIPNHNTAAFSRSFSYLAPKQYNQLPNNLKNLSLINFKKRLKQFMRDAHF